MTATSTSLRREDQAWRQERSQGARVVKECSTCGWRSTAVPNRCDKTSGPAYGRGCVWSVRSAA